MENLDQLVHTLPSDKQKEVFDFVYYLKTKYKTMPKKRRDFSFSWAGALTEFKDKYTSVELQHKILEMR